MSVVASMALLWLGPGWGEDTCKHWPNLRYRLYLYVIQRRFDAWHDEGTLTDLLWRGRTASG
jgi:hypothetical protein